MLTQISRAVGFVVMMTLSIIGADTLARKVWSWRKAYDKQVVAA